MTVNELVEWTAALVVVALIVGGAIALVATGGSWLQPRLKHMASGHKPVKGHLPCCPPGLGCNSPNKNERQHCLRLEARRVAKVNEIIAIDDAWAALNAVPVRKKKARAKVQAEYSRVRSEIIARALNDVSERIDEHSKLQLPRHVEAPAQQGEVMG